VLITAVQQSGSVIDPMRFVIHPRCVEGIKQMAGYKWKDKSVKDAPLKEEDDFCDSIRYLIVGAIGMRRSGPVLPSIIPGGQVRKTLRQMQDERNIKE